MVGTDWYVQGDIRLRTQYHRKVPRIESHLKWTLVQSGIHPPPGTTYDSWISCAPYFTNVSLNIHTGAICYFLHLTSTETPFHYMPRHC